MPFKPLVLIAILYLSVPFGDATFPLPPPMDQLFRSKLDLMRPLLNSTQQQQLMNAKLGPVLGPVLGAKLVPMTQVGHQIVDKMQQMVPNLTAISGNNFQSGLPISLPTGSPAPSPAGGPAPLPAGTPSGRQLDSLTNEEVEFVRKILNEYHDDQLLGTSDSNFERRFGFAPQRMASTVAGSPQRSQLRRLLLRRAMVKQTMMKRIREKIARSVKLLMASLTPGEVQFLTKIAAQRGRRVGPR